MKNQITEYIAGPVIYDDHREQIIDQNGNPITDMLQAHFYKTTEPGIRGGSEDMHDLGRWITSAINEKLRHEQKISLMDHDLQAKKQARDTELQEWTAALIVGLVFILMLLAFIAQITKNPIT